MTFLLAVLTPFSKKKVKKPQIFFNQRRRKYLRHIFPFLRTLCVQRSTYSNGHTVPLIIMIKHVADPLGTLGLQGQLQATAESVIAGLHQISLSIKFG